MSSLLSGCSGGGREGGREGGNEEEERVKPCQSPWPVLLFCDTKAQRDYNSDSLKPPLDFVLQMRLHAKC